MKLIGKLNIWWQRLWQKQRLSLYNRSNNSETWHMYISPLSILAGLCAFALVLFVIVLSLVSTTRVQEMLPWYQGNKSRQILTSYIMRIDSMSQQLRQIRTYTDDIALIMEGKTPVSKNVNEGKEQVIDDKKLVATSKADSILRQQMEGEGRYSLSNSSSTQDASSRASLELISPMVGSMVVMKYTRRENQSGIRLAATTDSTLVAVKEGTVISSVWSPEP